ncbi:MAG: hypothetical protein L3J72_03800 [Thermoplasmata archaeon]|nr:hypothetical protein [Thermoplasmata archaeon]
MQHVAPPSGRHVVGGVSIAALACVAALLLAVPLLGAPIGQGSAHPNGATPGPHGAPPAPFTYWVNWNGRGTANSSTIGSALSVTLGSTITLAFHWSGGTLGGPPGGVSEVEFQAFLFGFPFITRALTNNPALTTYTGVTNLTWDPGALNYIIAGDYQCLASIFAADGHTIWSESFYISVHAPYTVGALLPIILLLLVLFEVYAVLTVKPTPPKGTAAVPAPEKGTSSPASSESSEPPDPAAESPEAKT